MATHDPASLDGLLRRLAAHRTLGDPTDSGIGDATYRYRYDDFGNTTRIVGPGAGTTEPPPNLTGACTGSTNWTSPDTA